MLTISSPWVMNYAPCVYVFAKSISEFYECERNGIKGMRELCSGLTNLLQSHPEQKRIWVLFYLRTDTDQDYRPYDEDITRCRRICGSVINAGYVWKGGLEPPARWQDLYPTYAEHSIMRLDRNFIYPDEILSELTALKIYPMKKRKNIYYWITYFERP